MPRLPRPLRAVSGVLAATLAAGALALVAASPASATPVPHTPSGLPRAIEPMAQYVGQTACDPYTHAGTKALAHLLAATYGSYGGSGYNTSYACGTDGTQSEHYDGRAIDWMVSVRNSRQYAAGKAAIAWLLATDSHGNRFAMARRLGVMYVIYNNRMWGAWDGRWEQYNGCYKLKSHAYDNACHRTHVHISLSFNGALGHTSFWRKKVYADQLRPVPAARTSTGPTATPRPTTAGCRCLPGRARQEQRLGGEEGPGQVVRRRRRPHLARAGGERGAAGVPPVADRLLQHAHGQRGQGLPAPAPRLARSPGR